MVATTVRELIADGFESVGIFSHHNDTTSVLSDALRSQEIDHEIVGVPDAVTSALGAQFEMVKYASGSGHESQIWPALAIFVASLQRGQATPQLARMTLGTAERPQRLDDRLRTLVGALEAAPGVGEALSVAEAVPDTVGLERGDRPWRQATTLLRSILGPRLCRMGSFPDNGVVGVDDGVAEQITMLLTYADPPAPAAVQLMGLYQSKGRESDATIVIFREGDYYGREAEPMSSGSRLLYVVLTRARRKTVVLAFGSLPGLVAPLVALG